MSNDTVQIDGERWCRNSGEAIRDECRESAPNGTTIDVDGTPVVVEQGPTWLAELLYNPPEWFVYAQWIGFFVVAALIGLGIYVAVDDYADFAADAAEELLVVGFVAGGAAILSYTAAFPYWVDVAVGCSGGYLCAQAVLRGLPRALPGKS